MKYYICFGGNLIPAVFLPFVRPLNRKVVNHPSPKPEVHQVETVGLYRKIHVDRTKFSCSACSANQVVQQCRILKKVAVMTMLKPAVQYLAIYTI